MFRALVLTSVFALTACAAAPAETAIAPVTASGPLPAVFRDGRIYLHVALNSASPVWMELDTGTVPSVIDAGYAQTLGLDVKNSRQAGKGFGTAQVPVARTQAQITAGPIAANDIAFSVMPLHNMPGPDNQPVAGVLGFSFLAGRIITIDYASGTVRFADACTCDLRMTLDADVPSVPVMIAGHAVDALIDTGGGYDVLITPATANAIGLQGQMNLAAPVQGVGYGGAQAGRMGAGLDISAGGITRPASSALYSTFGTAPIKSGAALGFNFLQSARVTLNYRDHTARLETAD